MKRVFLPLSLAPLRLTAVLAFVAGMTYFLKGTPMPYHQRYLQTPFVDLPPTSQGLILALMHAAGSGLISIGLTLALLAWGPIPTGSAWASKAALVMVTAAMVPMVIVTLRVGYYTPWWVIALLGISSVAGLWRHSVAPGR